MLAAPAIYDDRVVAPAALMATGENEPFLPVPGRPRTRGCRPSDTPLKNTSLVEPELGVDRVHLPSLLPVRGIIRERDRPPDVHGSGRDERLNP
jgi:hypothetical protein